MIGPRARILAALLAPAAVFPVTELEAFLRDYCATHPQRSVAEGVLAFFLRPPAEPSTPPGVIAVRGARGSSPAAGI